MSSVKLRPTLLLGRLGLASVSFIRHLLQIHEENGQITAVTFVWDSDTETETDAEVEADGSGENSSSVITVQPRYVVDDDYAPYERGRKRRRSPLGGG